MSEQKKIIKSYVQDKITEEYDFRYQFLNT